MYHGPMLKKQLDEQRECRQRRRQSRELWNKPCEHDQGQVVGETFPAAVAAIERPARWRAAVDSLTLVALGVAVLAVFPPHPAIVALGVLCLAVSPLPLRDALRAWRWERVEDPR